MKLLVVLVSILELAGCMNPVRDLPQLPTDVSAAYLLGPGDNLQVNIFGEPDLTGTYRVSEGGAVVIPLVGAVPASGTTIETFQQTLVEHLKANALQAPSVSVSVTDYRPFFILGEVKNPGSYPYVPNMTVLTAVAIAGGFTYRAAETQLSVTRTSNGHPAESRALRDSRVLPGDVVNVFERHF
jgi:polysaccharide biosynthesis/export protein